MVVTRDRTGFNLNHPTPVSLMRFRVPREAIGPLVGSVLGMVPAGTEAVKLLVTKCQRASRSVLRREGWQRQFRRG